MFAFVAPYTIVVFLFFCVVFLFWKKTRLLGFLFLLIALCVDVYFCVYPINIIPESNKCKLRIMTYNVHGSGVYMRNHRDSLHGVVNFIDRIDADILVLQEYDRGTDSALFSSLLNIKYPFHSSMYCKEIGTYDPIYSKYPIRDFCWYYSPLRMQVFGMQVLIDDRWIYLVNCHLASNKYTVARDSMKVEESWVSGIPQYYKYLKNGYLRRRVETNAIADSIRLHKGVPVLVCGDFNDVSGSYALKTIQSAGDLKDAWWSGGCGFGWTYDAHHLKLRLDHILYSKDFELVNVSVPHVKFSDHYPVVADFVFKK